MGLLVLEIQSEARICTSNTLAADTDAVGTTDTDVVGASATDAVGVADTDAVGVADTDAVGVADTDAAGTTDTDVVLLLRLLILMSLGPLIPMLLDFRTTLPT